MKVIYEPNIERMDFLELALTSEEYEQIQSGGFVFNFCDWQGANPVLNIYIRLLRTKEINEETHERNQRIGRGEEPIECLDAAIERVTALKRPKSPKPTVHQKGPKRKPRI